VVSETAHALQVVGHYAFVAGGSCDEDAPAWRDGLMIVDLSNPANPVPVAGLTTPGWGAGIQVVGDRAYLADGPGGLLIVSLPEALPSALFHPAWRDGVFTVAVPTHGGQGYALEFKRALDETQWTPLPLVPGAGGVQTLTDPSATDPRRFYRVVSY
jgi:hypothetical protein